MMKQTLLTDQEFYNLTLPLTQEEQERLERSLMREGCLEPIITWHGFILDGYKRFKFCSYEEIEFTVHEMELATREEAISWACRERIAKIDRSTPAFRYLMGKWYISRKTINRRLKREYYKAHPGDRKQETAHDDIPKELKNRSAYRKAHKSPWDTSIIMSGEVGIDHSTIEQYGMYAGALDKIASTEPELFRAIMLGTVSFTKKETLKLAQDDERKLAAVRRKLLNESEEKMRKRRSRKAQKENNSMETVKEIPLSVGIKEMPPFDPDMELKGLALTIPMWISAIARAEKNTNMELATDRVKTQLAATLGRLEEQIHRTLEVLK